jgi:hypothetical protein
MPQSQNPLAALNPKHRRLASAFFGGFADELRHVAFAFSE